MACGFCSPNRQTISFASKEVFRRQTERNYYLLSNKKSFAIFYLSNDALIYLIYSRFKHFRAQPSEVGSA